MSGSTHKTLLTRLERCSSILYTPVAEDGRVQHSAACAYALVPLGVVELLKEILKEKADTAQD